MQNNIVVYENGEIEIKVSVDERQETIWLRQSEISKLFGMCKKCTLQILINL